MASKAETWCPESEVRRQCGKLGFGTPALVSRGLLIRSVRREGQRTSRPGHWRDLLRSGAFIVSPGVYDGYSARLVEAAGYRTAATSGAAVSNVLLGIADIGVLGLFGHSLTTDHISPGGEIPEDSEAGRYLISLGVEPRDFNTYVGRRGNHEVMTRATFANLRIRNQLVPGREGGVSLHHPSGAVLPVHEVAALYRAAGIPAVILAGAEYGTGSSRDWAAKGTAPLGIRAVIAESHERIHRSNLVGLGVLPLSFMPGESWTSLGLDGSETYDIADLEAGLRTAPPSRSRRMAPGARRACACARNCTRRMSGACRCAAAWPASCWTPCSAGPETRPRFTRDPWPSRDPRPSRRGRA